MQTSGIDWLKLHGRSLDGLCLKIGEDEFHGTIDGHLHGAFGLVHPCIGSELLFVFLLQRVELGHTRRCALVVKALGLSAHAEPDQDKQPEDQEGKNASEESRTH